MDAPYYFYDQTPPPKPGLIKRLAKRLGNISIFPKNNYEDPFADLWQEVQYEAKLTKTKKEMIERVSKYMFIVGVLFLFASFAPSVYYKLAEVAGINTNSLLLKQTALASSSYADQLTINAARYQPPHDSSLPMQNMLIIPGTRIETQIHEETVENFEAALQRGVWRVPDFGDPYDRKLPMILAAHRFGYLKWSVPYRLKNSFYQLPNVKAGDTVYVVWNQRKYTYAIYKEELGTEITDYSADLILYTCQDLNSDKRVVRYARLLEI